MDGMDESNKMLAEKLTVVFRSMLESSMQEVKETITKESNANHHDLQLRVQALEAEMKSVKKTLRIDKQTHKHRKTSNTEVEPFCERGSVNDQKVDTNKLIKAPRHSRSRSMDTNISEDTMMTFYSAVNKSDPGFPASNNNKHLGFSSLSKKSDSGFCAGNNNSDHESMNRDGETTSGEESGGTMSPYMWNLAYFCHVLKRKKVVNNMSIFENAIKISRSVNNRTVTDTICHVSDLERIFNNLDRLLRE